MLSNQICDAFHLIAQFISSQAKSHARPEGVISVKRWLKADFPIYFSLEARRGKDFASIGKVMQPSDSSVTEENENKIDSFGLSSSQRKEMHST